MRAVPPAAALFWGAVLCLAQAAGAIGVIAPALAAAKPATAERGAKHVVPVRVGKHEGFSRVVFDWPLAVDYGVRRKGRTVTIRFRRAARIDLTRLSPKASAILVGREVKEGPDWTLVKFKVAQGVRIRHFRFGSGVVLDVLEPGATAAEVPGGKAGIVRPAAKKTSSSPPRKTPPQKTPPQKTGTKWKPRTKLKPRTALKPKAPRALAKKAGTPATKKRATAGRTGTRASSASRKGVQPASRKGAQPASRKGARPASARPRGLVARKNQAPVSKVTVTRTVYEKATVLRFHWAAPVGAAVFMRGGYLWAVFDREANMAFQGWGKKALKRVKRALRRKDRIPFWVKRLGKPKTGKMPGTSIFRMFLPAGILPRVTKEDHTWVVTLSEQINTSVAAIPVAPRFVPVLGASIHLTVRGAGTAVAIPDPAAGDRVWVVPVAGPGKGIGVARSFAEVELLATAQGIAGRALGDGVKFRTLRQGVEITAPGGLSLSGTNVSSARTAAARGKRARELIGGESWLFEIKKLHQVDGDAFAAIKHRFLEAAYKAGPTEISRARSRLAQLHFAHGLYADVIAILRVVEADDPKFVNDPVYRALRGASYFSLGQQQRAPP